MTYLHILFFLYSRFSRSSDSDSELITKPKVAVNESCNPISPAIDGQVIVSNHAVTHKLVKAEIGLKHNRDAAQIETIAVAR